MTQPQTSSRWMLEQSIQAQALVAAGDVLRACGRGVAEDAVTAYCRFARMMGRTQLESATWHASGLLTDLMQQFVLLLCNLDALDARRHWRDTDHCIRMLAKQKSDGFQDACLQYYAAVAKGTYDTEGDDLIPQTRQLAARFRAISEGNLS